MCEVLHVLPSQLLREDPEWLRKLKVVLVTRAEKAERDSKP